MSTYFSPKLACGEPVILELAKGNSDPGSHPCISQIEKFSKKNLSENCQISKEDILKELNRYSDPSNIQRVYFTVGPEIMVDTCILEEGARKEEIARNKDFCLVDARCLKKISSLEDREFSIVAICSKTDANGSSCDEITNGKSLETCVKHRIDGQPAPQLKSPEQKSTSGSSKSQPGEGLKNKPRPPKP